MELYRLRLRLEEDRTTKLLNNHLIDRSLEFLFLHCSRCFELKYFHVLYFSQCRYDISWSSSADSSAKDTLSACPFKDNMQSLERSPGRPKFGNEFRKHFLFDEDYLNMNHGMLQIHMPFALCSITIPNEAMAPHEIRNRVA